MMPTIRIDNEVWAFLKSKAEPLADSPNSVLRRLFSLDKPVRSRRRLAPGRRTPQAAYRRPILQALHELGGKAPVDKVLARVERKMKRILKSVDYEKTSTGMIRWRNSAMWERKAMVDEGLLRRDSPHGKWELQ